MAGYDMRNRLVELYAKAKQNALGKEFTCSRERNMYVADFLISHGVTVKAEARLYWKPVDERTSNLTCSACDSHLGCREDAKFCPECGAKFVTNDAKPPKGE